MFLFFKNERNKDNIILYLIVNFILSEISSNNTIYLHAQEAVVNFYKKLGFKVSGKKFYEADILHSKMIYSL